MLPRAEVAGLEAVLAVLAAVVEVRRGSARLRVCTGGELGGDRPGVPESGLSHGGGEPVLLRGEDAPEADRSERGVLRGEGDRVKASAEEEDSTESWLSLSPPFLLSGWKVMAAVMAWPR